MFQQNINLTPFTTFGVPVKTKYFATFSSENELKYLLSIINKEKKNEKLLVLGGGSNLLFTKDFDGITLKNEIKGISIVEENDNNVVLCVGAGENWHQFVLYTISKNWGGIENLSLIPGCVGASPIQNIGAYGVEIKDVFVALEAIEIETGEFHIFTNEECKFGYRESIFKKEAKGKYIITSVLYCLSKNRAVDIHYGAIGKELESRNIEHPSIKDVSDVVIAIRKAKLPDPKEIGSAGSFFKNPIVPISLYEDLKQRFESIPHYPIDADSVKIPAGWLIDSLGWKGKSYGDYGVHQQQALVLVNYKHTPGKLIYELSEEIVKDVEKNYGITLEREVNIM